MSMTPDFMEKLLVNEFRELYRIREKLGVINGRVYYRASRYTPKVDKDGKPAFFFFRLFGYWILNTDSVEEFRALVSQGGFELVELKPEEESVPGWPRQGVKF